MNKREREEDPIVIRQRRRNPKVNIIYLLFMICGINFLIYSIRVFVVSA